MELKTLILGVFMSTAVFALKSGGGLAYLLIRSRGTLQKFTLSLLFTAGWALTFAGAALVIARVNFTAHLTLLQTFFKSGMTIHFVLAALLLFWGLALIRQQGQAPGAPAPRASKTWLALVLPCPVCFSVILLSLGFAQALYPGKPFTLAALLYLSFILVSLGTAVTFSRRVKDAQSRAAEHFLGTLMLYIAAYFLLSVIVIPAFADLGKIYRLSLSRAPVIFTAKEGATALLALAALIAGFFYPLKGKV